MVGLLYCIISSSSWQKLPPKTFANRKHVLKKTCSSSTAATASSSWCGSPGTSSFGQRQRLHVLLLLLLLSCCLRGLLLFATPTAESYSIWPDIILGMMMALSNQRQRQRPRRIVEGITPPTAQTTDRPPPATTLITMMCQRNMASDRATASASHPIPVPLVSPFCSRDSPITRHNSILSDGTGRQRGGDKR